MYQQVPAHTTDTMSPNKRTYLAPHLDIYAMPAECGFQASGSAGDGDYGDFGVMSTGRNYVDLHNDDF